MKTILTVLLLVTALAVHAQTNTTSPAPSSPSVTSPSPQVVKVADDVRSLVLDLAGLLGNISWPGFLLSAYLAVKGLRNKTSLGRGPLAPLFNLLNLEAVPAKTVAVPLPASPVAAPVTMVVAEKGQ